MVAINNVIRPANWLLACQDRSNSTQDVQTKLGGHSYLGEHSYLGGHSSLGSHSGLGDHSYLGGCSNLGDNPVSGVIQVDELLRFSRPFRLMSHSDLVCPSDLGDYSGLGGHSDSGKLQKILFHLHFIWPQRFQAQNRGFKI